MRSLNHNRRIGYFIMQVSGVGDKELGGGVAAPPPKLERFAKVVLNRAQNQRNLGQNIRK